jgi:hypothetical protein
MIRKSASKRTEKSMGIFTIGKDPFQGGHLGNPHALAMEDNDLHLPPPPPPIQQRPRPPNPVVSGPHHDRQRALTDAVVAASNILNNSKTDSSVMGQDPEVNQISQTICATARSALQHENEIGQPRFIRLALFVDEWNRFRQTMAMKEFVDQLAAQKKSEYRTRAQAWANEIHDAIANPQGSYLATCAKIVGNFTWKKLLIGGGIFGAIFLGLKLYASWKDESEPRSHHQGGEKPKYVFAEKTA